MSVNNKEKLDSDFKNVKKLIDEALNENYFKEELNKNYKLYYLILLKMVYFNKKLKSEKQKIKTLIEFMHNELHVVTLRELSIAIVYFKEDKKPAIID